jgi:Raf kinase inhibitor-like YbhB/YbcL family protein
MIHLTSTVFKEGQPIPTDYTCSGPDQSPPLTWNNLPTDTVSVALICDDPDAPAGTWVHWVIYNIPPDMNGLPLNVPKTETLPSGARQGVNDFGRIGYGGPCPPRGKPHRYYFKLYALDAQLSLAPGATRQALLDAMKGHVLAEGQLMGTFRR